MSDSMAGADEEEHWLEELLEYNRNVPDQHFTWLAERCGHNALQ